MTCRLCGLVKNKETRKYFIPKRNGHCRGCTNYKYFGNGYIGRRMLAKSLTPRKPKRIIVYSHSTELTGRDFSRERVRIRDNRTCQACGRVWQEGQRRLDVHHLEGLCGKLSKKYDRITMMPKLITLCHKCHYSHHQFSKRLDGTYKPTPQQRSRL